MNGNSLEAPLTNRGAVNTYNTDLKRCIICDWCQFSIFYYGEEQMFEKARILDIKRFAISLFTKLFKIDSTDLIFETGGINGYDNTISYKNIYCYYSVSRIDMGVNFKLSGSGCRDYESLNLGWNSLFQKLKEYNVNYNRIDIAIDDFTNPFFI